MRQIRFWTSMVCAALAVVSFAGLHGSPHSARAASANSTNLVIVKLAGRDVTVTISAGRNGSLYSATDRWGNALATNLSLDQLRAQRPDVYRQLQPALCGADSAWAGAE